LNRRGGRGKESKDLHNLVHVPENRVGMVGFGWIKPKVDPLLSVTLATSEHVGLQYVRLPCPVAQELKVYLIML